MAGQTMSGAWAEWSFDYFLDARTRLKILKHRSYIHPGIPKRPRAATAALRPNSRLAVICDPYLAGYAVTLMREPRSVAAGEKR